MRSRHVAQGIVFSLCILFVSSGMAFPEENNPLILQEYFTKTQKEIKKGSRAEKKICGLLQIQVQLKNSYREQPTSERLTAMKRMGMRTEETDKQQVYIHLKKKLSDSRIASLKKMGVIVDEDSWIPPLENHPTGYVIATMPVDKLNDLARKSFVVRLDTAERMLLPKNDNASESIQADKVWDYGYDGAGVRIAVLDSGLDTSHNDIPDPVESKDYSNYPRLDDTIENQISGHGTHVTGSAVGRGTQSDGKYKGMAYGADLIFLKIGDDSTAGASTTAISAAIKAAVDNYDADIITMSYGGFDTYNDGSEEDCQAVDYAYSKGSLVFMAAGNEADSNIHYSGTVTANSTTDYIQINIDASSGIALYFYLNWFDGTETSNDLDLSLYNANKTEMSSNVSRYEETESSRGTEAELAYFNNYVSGPATFYLKVKNNSDNNQFFHIYSYDYYATFENADPDYTIGAPATADNAIAVASYSTRLSWTDYRGNSWTSTGTLGGISSFSSHGPRIDGRQKPDIAAPGERIISARDKIITWPGDYDSYIIDNDGISDGNGPADYVLFRGTSMATPIAAGAAALLMQSDTSLKGDPDSIRDILFQTASNNGEQTNTDGYGKMDVLAALDYVASPSPAVSTSPVISPTQSPAASPSPSVSPSPVTSPTPQVTPSPSPIASPSPRPSPSPATASGSISGFVYDEDGGRGLEDVDITITGSSYGDSTATDADGYFNLVDLKPGDYTLTFEKDGYITQTRSVTLDEGENYNVEVVMEPSVGSIYGYVTDTAGDALARAKIKAKKAGKTIKTTYTDSDGYYVFTDLEADDYHVIARKRGYYKAREKLELEDGEDVQIDFELEER